MDTKDYTFFGQAVTQAEFAVLIRSVIQDHKCPYCEKPAFVRCGLIAHAKKCKSLPNTMYDTLEARLTAAGHRTTKLHIAFDALEFANGNVSEAKRIAAKHGDRIAARTWYKAITARLAHFNK